ncbi:MULTISPECIES: phage Gp37/Gp68 family protein [unclassified Sphingomonas]|uniref:phage Gp37/Gp68 family protein n=1 Tax=Sphingomonas sp. PvP015 TaxID=3156388 RepID=UPI0033953B26
MAENSAIEWTNHTFNPWIGCTKVGPGCDHCYAEALAGSRLGVPWGPGAPRRRTGDANWKQPRRWNRRAAAAGARERVFCASLADVFDNEVDPAWRVDLFRLIVETPHLDWLLVTKRVGNASKMASAAGGWPANVWLGATIVDQAEADRDLPKLLAVDGPRFRFLSMEPLLEPVAFDPCDLSALDWVIVGGESGPSARPMHPDWARSMRDQCAVAFVPFLFKQWGENAWAERVEGDPSTLTAYRAGKKYAGRLLDGVTHDGLPVAY